MSWQAVTFDWNQARAFLATAEEGSLSAAARALRLTQPTLGRQVAALEDALGVVLFERVGRGLALTPAGRDLLEHVKTMRDAAMRMSLAASCQSQAIDGVVRITASDIFCAYLLPPVIAELRQIAPRLEIDLVAANDLRDLQRREADIALRHVRPDQPELFARLVQEATAHFYAATSYLDRRGRPQSLDALQDHDFIAFGEAEEMVGFLRAISVPVQTGNFRLGSANGLVAWSMVTQGLGVAVMSDIVAEQTPGIERLFPDMAPVTFPVWLTTHRELQTSRRIRLVYDHLAGALSAKKSPRPPELPGDM